MPRRTQIIATLGPASEDLSMIKKLIHAGANWARINASHGSYEEYKKIIKNLKTASKESKKEIFFFLDLQGPKIRLGELPKEGIPAKKGSIAWLVNKKKIQNSFLEQSKKIIQKNEIDLVLPLPYVPLHKKIQKGARLFIEDGLIRTKIVSKKEGLLLAELQNAGILKSHKGVNIPDTTLPRTSSLPLKDKKDLAFAIQELGLHHFALSFVEDEKDIERVRKLAKRYTKAPLTLIAKIERPNALKNLAAIAQAADLLMVARGDLGVETPAEQVPLEQLTIIAEAHKAGKKVIVATQMLESMTENPIATRAEVSDAATAVFEGADAVMLSNETAVGAYPVEAVETLNRTLSSIEKSDLHFPKEAC